MNQVLLFFENKFSKKEILSTLGFMLFFLMLLSTLCFTYSPKLHLLPLFLQIVFFVYSIILFWNKKKRFDYYLLFIVFLFAFSLFISLLINGYDSHYNTVVTGLFILLGTYFFCKALNDSINIIKGSVYLCLILFCFFFLFTYFKEIIDAIINKQFDYLRLGEKIAPINMITISFVSPCVMSLYFLFFVKKAIILKILNVLLFFISFFCGVLTGSKQFIVSCVLISLILLFLFFGKKRWYLSLISSIIIIIGIVLIFSLPAFSTISTRFLEMLNTVFGIGVNGKVDYSTSERTLMIQEGFYLFSQRPIFGYGLWGFALNTSFGTYSHNTFSNSLAEMGIVGSTFYFLILSYPVINFVKKHNYNEKYALIIFLIYLMQCFFGVIYWHKLTYLLIGLSIVISEEVVLLNRVAQKSYNEITI